MTWASGLIITGGILQAAGVILLLVGALRLKGYLDQKKYSISAVGDFGYALPLRARQEGQSDQQRIEQLEALVQMIREQMVDLRDYVNQSAINAIEAAKRQARRDHDELVRAVIGSSKQTVNIYAVLPLVLVFLGVVASTWGALLALD